jgi:hypothetical protein
MPRLPALPSRRIPVAIAMKFAGLPSYDRPKGLRTSDPEPGYFKLRFVRRGPWVPAIIWRPCPLILPDPLEATAPGPEQWCCPAERSRALRARIGDREASPDEVWERGREIPEHEYIWRLAVRDWAMAYQPTQPEANPRKAVDLSAQPSLF